MKKIQLSSPFCFLLLFFCLCASCMGAKTPSSSSKNINDTIHFFQICTDTVYLPKFRPNEAGRYVLDKVLNPGHQNLSEFPHGTFMISGKVQSDTLLTVLFLYRSIDFFAQHGWDAFRGIVYYKKHTFLIWRNVSAEDVDVLFEDTGQEEGFPEYADRLYVKVDEKIVWRFVKRNGGFYFMDVYPPSTIIDFDETVFEQHI